VWLYYRFGVSLRDVSELMLARGIEVSHEAIRLCTLRFGTEYARRLRRRREACFNIWLSSAKKPRGQISAEILATDSRLAHSRFMSLA
jgi:hypothetical protein